MLSLSSCVSVFWFRYWLPALPALKFHLEGHEDEQSYGAVLGDLKKLVFHREKDTEQVRDFVILSSEKTSAVA